jgi:antitoxin component YwqK of YwqJK toxin-antitoxin module
MIFDRIFEQEFNPMKKQLLLFLLLLIGFHISAKTFYEQLCAINSNWEQYSFSVPIHESKLFSSDQEYIQAHLTAVENLLRSKNIESLSPQQQSERKNNLDILHTYILAGIFPINYYETFRTPVFIDEHGTHCAVGYLMMCSGHDDLARRISAKDNYIFVKNIDDPELSDWQQASGFSVEELALIQPTYGNPRPDPTSILQEPSCGTRYLEDVEYPQTYPVFVLSGSGTISASDNKPAPKHIWCKGQCKNGVLNGKWIQYFNEKLIWVEGTFVDGKKSGTWTIYLQAIDGNGKQKVKNIEHWSQGKLNGLYSTFDYYGKKTDEGNYLNGLKEGEWMQWANGILYMKSNYHNGKLNGDFSTYSPRYGKLIVQSVYKDGLLLSQKNYTIEGSLASEKKWIDEGVYEVAEYHKNGKLRMKGCESFYFKADSSFIYLGGEIQTLAKIEVDRKIGIWWFYPEWDDVAHSSMGDSSKAYFENDSMRWVVAINTYRAKGRKDSLCYNQPIYFNHHDYYWVIGTNKESESWYWMNSQLISHIIRWPNGATHYQFSYRDGKLMSRYYCSQSGRSLESWVTQMKGDSSETIYTQSAEDGTILMKGPLKDSTIRYGQWEFRDTLLNVTGGGKYIDNVKVGYWTELNMPTVGMCASGNYVNGIKEGQWKEVNVKTNEYSIGKYKHGKRKGVWKFYKPNPKLDHRKRFH